MFPSVPSSDYEAHFYAYPYLHSLAPFKIMGNVYYVGDENVSIHLIDTGEGLIVIDTGYPEKQAWMIQGIWALGFRPDMVKYIIHTHGHFDHMGGTDLLKQLAPEAKTCISAIDAKIMREQPEMVFADCHPLRYDCYFEPDIELHDFDEIHLGDTHLWVRDAPGHTMGTLAVFFNVHAENGKEYIAGIHGGLGHNTLTRAYIEKYHIHGARKGYREQMERLKNEKVDMMLCVHSKHIDLLTKRAQMIEHPEGPNPFLDPTAWRRNLELAQQRFAEFEKEDPMDE